MSDTDIRNGSVVVNRAMSLDGFIAGPSHSMDWIMSYVSPDEFPEVMAATGAMLAGRRTYEVGKRDAAAGKASGEAYGGAWSGPMSPVRPFSAGSLTRSWCTLCRCCSATAYPSLRPVWEESISSRSAAHAWAPSPLSGSGCASRHRTESPVIEPGRQRQARTRRRRAARAGSADQRWPRPPRPLLGRRPRRYAEPGAGTR